MKPHLQSLTLFALASLLSSHAFAQAVRHANASLTTGANNGSSWPNAFRGPLALQSALGAAQSGDEIWVASGTYFPALSGAPHSSTFQLKENVKLLGGFAGTEASAAQRDAQANICILDGDLDGPIEGFPIDRVDHVVSAINLSPASRIDGFTIRGGLADGDSEHACGGGILVFAGAPAIRNCTFLDNEASMGAGLALISATSIVEGCTFGPNYAQAGAGLANISGDPVVRDCTFAGQYPSTGGNTGLGIHSGEISNSGAPGITVENCRFSIQAAQFSCPAGIAYSSSEGSHSTFTDCAFIGNTGCGAGAMQVEGIVEIDRCTFIGNEGLFDGGAAIHSFDGDVTVSNSLFSGNDRFGFSTISTGGKLRLNNCTLADNGADFEAPGNGGAHFLIVNQSADIAISNSIIWGNLSMEEDATAVLSPWGTGPIIPRFDSCIVQSWGSFLSPVAGQNTFAADPLFIAVPGNDGIPGTLDDNLHLQPTSPAIDRGDNALLAPEFTLDRDKNPRRRDDPATPDFTPGASPQIDLGTFEFIPACPGDLNADGLVDDADFVLFASAYNILDCADPAMPAGCPSDLNHDASVDDADFVAFANAYNALICP